MRSRALRATNEHLRALCAQQRNVLPRFPRKKGTPSRVQCATKQCVSKQRIPSFFYFLLARPLPSRIGKSAAPGNCVVFLCTRDSYVQEDKSSTNRIRVRPQVDASINPRRGARVDLRLIRNKPRNKATCGSKLHLFPLKFYLYYLNALEPLHKGFTFFFLYFVYLANAQALQ